MKKIILIAVVFCTSLVNGQTATSYASSKTSSSTTHSNVSISVSDSNEVYSYSVIFDRSKSAKAIKEIEKTFGKPIIEGKNYVWRESDVLEIKAREGRVTIELEKGSTKLYEKVRNMGIAIAEVVGEKS